MSEGKKLTSVKLDEDLFEDFKVQCVRMKFLFQKLAERTMHLYMTDEDFRKKIHNYKDLDYKK